MPNIGENSAGFQEGAAYTFTQHPETNQAALPLSLRTNAIQEPSAAENTNNLLGAKLTPSGIPSSPPMSMPLTQPKLYQVNLSENLGVSDSSSPTRPPPVNTIIAYKAGIDQNGNRYQTPIYQNQPTQQKADVPDPFSGESTKSLIDTIGTESGIKQAQSTALGNGLIDLSNQQIQARNDRINQENQVIQNTNNVLKADNAIDKLANFGIMKNNSVIENANSVIRGNNAIDRLANEGIQQQNQLIEQQNINAKVNNAIDRLAIKGFVDNAAKSGVKSFDLLGPSAIGGAFGSQGVKLGTTTPEKAVSDLQSYQQKGIPVSLSYQPTNGFSATLGEQGVKEVYGNPFGEFLKGSQAVVNSLIGKNTGLTLSGIVTKGAVEAPTRAPSVIQSIQPTFGTKLYTPPEQESPTAKSLTSLITQRPYYAAGSLFGEAGVQGLTFGAGKGVEVGSNLIRTGLGKGIVTDIANAARTEGTIAPEIEKVNPNTFHITQGTEGRTITPSTKLEKILNIFREPTKEKIIPGYGKIEGNKYAEIANNFQESPLIKPGKVSVNESRNPNEVKIPKEQGEAAIGNIYVTTGKNGSVTYVPNIISEDAKETSILIGKEVNPELVSRLNLTPSERVPGFFEGKITPESNLILREAANKGLISKVGQGFTYPLEDVAKDAGRYAEISINPALLGEEGIAVQEKILPDITRPDVTAIYQTENKGFEAGKGLNVYKGIQYGSKGEDYFINSYANLNFKPVINPVTGAEEEIRGFSLEKESRPTKSKPLNFGGEFTTSTPEKVGAGASGKANALINQPKTESILKDLFKTETVQKEPKVGDYLGLTPQIQKGRTRETQETEIVAFPPGTKAELVGKHIGLQGLNLQNDVLESAKEKQAQANRGTTLYKLSSELSQRQSERNLLKTLDITIGKQQSELTRQSLRFDVGSVLKSAQGQNQRSLLSQDTLTRQLTKQTPIQTERLGSGQTQDQLPRLTQLTKLMPLTPLLTPRQTTKPPKIDLGFGGGFDLPFGTAGGKKRKTGHGIKSYFAYSVNPNVVGAIEQAGLPGLQTSSSSSIYGKVDKQLEKATRLNFKGTKIRF